MKAIFIAGPLRYLDKIISQIDTHMKGETLEYSYFIHVWKTDKGNKKREDGSVDITEVIANPRVKFFVVEEGYSEEDLNNYGYYSKEELDLSVETPPSKINAFYGMMYSMRVLMRSLKSVLDYDKYTHILRLRTDVVILNKSLLIEIFGSEHVCVPHNHMLGNDYCRICDHIWYSNIGVFEKIWCRSFSVVYFLHRLLGKSPETTLGVIKVLSMPFTSVKKNIFRDVDYHIIYDLPRGYDPRWRHECSSPQEIFDNACVIYRSEETAALKENHLNKILLNAARPFFIKIYEFLKRLF
ncbi:hypothetical protein [Pseudoalteromonas sp.]|uniref:hypothetical protein n=1 Tax=Pseudoalteromonas sp. TaxID=53249 RepID=UPI0026252FDE|nr:hypothetical protein [Pseudoalteromonas sp.]MCP4588762.1 hypothetical protein [Pseudoalteromonas sp.]